MLKIVRSGHSVRRSLKDDPIILIYQFFKHRKQERNYEIKECLWKNANNEYTCKKDSNHIVAKIRCSSKGYCFAVREKNK